MKPKPRGAGAGAGRDTITGALAGKDGKEENGKRKSKSEYQIFVSNHFSRVKREMAEKGLDTQMGRVMVEIAREYREIKRQREQGKEEETKKEEDVGDDFDLAFKGLSLES